MAPAAGTPIKSAKQYDDPNFAPLGEQSLEMCPREYKIWRMRAND